jgi:type II secretory pathway pseudopilin PulG
MIELLIVVAILLILVSLLSPSLKKMVAIAHKTNCMNNEKSIFLSIDLYLQDYVKLHKRQNGGLWQTFSGTSLSSTHGLAYWGVAYGVYLEERESWLCPESLSM